MFDVGSLSKTFKVVKRVIYFILKRLKQDRVRFVGKQAEETTTIAFNATKEEKRILIRLAAKLPVRGHSELVRRGYLEWLKTAYPEAATEIQRVRDDYAKLVSQRVADGAKKRGNNIKKAHGANSVGAKDVDAILAEGIASGDLAQQKHEAGQQSHLKRRPKKDGGGKTSKKGGQ